MPIDYFLIFLKNIKRFEWKIHKCNNNNELVKIKNVCIKTHCASIPLPKILEVKETSPKLIEILRCRILEVKKGKFKNRLTNLITSI